MGGAVCVLLGRGAGEGSFRQVRAILTQEGKAALLRVLYQKSEQVQSISEAIEMAAQENEKIKREAEMITQEKIANMR